ncbi:MAG: saccharopine dehydrogenase, partial [Chitinophagia bacterium]|nr:saccharopine dehydrogenase [Chitinophagia bacterium]
MVKEKLAPYPYLVPQSLNLEIEAERIALIEKADLVISLLPPFLQATVGKDCLQLGKHFLSASYTDPALLALDTEIKQKNLLFLMEMGLDPGIDHMSALQLIHRIKDATATITGFASHCGGLVAPACDTNRWHYKFSWNPRNVILAGKAGALFKENGNIQQLTYAELFNFRHPVQIDGLGELATYPNRDSLPYIPIYNLETAQNFIRTTLRYPEFCEGWNWLIKLGCTTDDNQIISEGMCYKDYFNLQLSQSQIPPSDIPLPILQMLKEIGWEDTHRINRKSGSSADILQEILENKWALQPGDRDMIVMLHEIQYTQKNSKFLLRSQLIVEGDNEVQTAMAKTVGLPLGIAAILLLEGK